MNGELAQIIFLVAYGNAYLYNSDQPMIVDHWLQRPPFRYLSSLSFISLRK